LDKFLNILLVEDNLDSVEIIKRVLKTTDIPNKLWVFQDGEDALKFLKEAVEKKDKSLFPFIDFILLDINLPKLNGLEVLKEIKSSSDLKLIPVIMLTVSSREEDVLESYSLGCSSFVQKPVRYEDFEDVLKEIILYWGRRNITPNERRL